MSDLISREALYEATKDTTDVSYMAAMILCAPAVDAVEVVRCKDCKYRNTKECSMWVECCDCKSQWSWESDDDYCSYGERRESEVKE